MLIISLLSSNYLRHFAISLSQTSVSTDEPVYAFLAAPHFGPEPAATNDVRESPSPRSSFPETWLWELSFLSSVSGLREALLNGFLWVSGFPSTVTHVTGTRSNAEFTNLLIRFSDTRFRSVASFR